MDEELKRLREQFDEANGTADLEWHEAFDAWFARRYPESRWGSSSGTYQWMKHAALSAVMWTSGMLPEDDKVFDE